MDECLTEWLLACAEHVVVVILVKVHVVKDSHALHISQLELEHTLEQAYRTVAVALVVHRAVAVFPTARLGIAHEDIGLTDVVKKSNDDGILAGETVLQEKIDLKTVLCQAACPVVVTVLAYA